VADVGGGNAVAGEKLLLEGEDAEKALYGAAHFADAALAPSPGLGGDEVDDGDTLAVESAGNAEVKIRGVGEDGEVGFAGGGGGEQFAVLAVDAGDVGDNLDEADDGEAGGINDGVDAGGAEAGAGTAEECGIGENAPKFPDDQGGVEVARGLSGRYQDGGHSFTV
jgi:hypothetical protein